MKSELYHHGIKGQKWGIRRFQNPDGSLTAAGKLRERSTSDRALRREAKKQREWNAKNSSRLSDKELTDQILRLQREKQLKDLTNQTVSPGKKRVKDFLVRNGELALGTLITAGVSAGVTARVTDAVKPKKTEDQLLTDEINRATRQRIAKEVSDRTAAQLNLYSKNYENDGSVKPRNQNDSNKKSNRKKDN